MDWLFSNVWLKINPVTWFYLSVLRTARVQNLQGPIVMSHPPWSWLSFKCGHGVPLYCFHESCIWKSGSIMTHTMGFASLFRLVGPHLVLFTYCETHTSSKTIDIFLFFLCKMVKALDLSTSQEGWSNTEDLQHLISIIESSGCILVSLADNCGPKSGTDHHRIPRSTGLNKMASDFVEYSSQSSETFLSKLSLTGKTQFFTKLSSFETVSVVSAESSDAVPKSYIAFRSLNSLNKA